MMMMVNEFIFQ